MKRAIWAFLAAGACSSCVTRAWLREDESWRIAEIMHRDAPPAAGTEVAMAPGTPLSTDDSRSDGYTLDTMDGTRKSSKRKSSSSASRRRSAQLAQQ